MIDINNLVYKLSSSDEEFSKNMSTVVKAVNNEFTETTEKLELSMQRKPHPTEVN